MTIFSLPDTDHTMSKDQFQLIQTRCLMTRIRMVNLQAGESIAINNTRLLRLNAWLRQQGVSVHNVPE